MIITPDPLEPFDVPIDADFTLRFKTPFSSGQMTAATKTVKFWDTKGILSEKTAAADGADLVFQVTPGMFTAGRWTFKPVAVVSSRKYSWPSAGAMDVIPDGLSHAGAAC